MAAVQEIVLTQNQQAFPGPSAPNNFDEGSITVAANNEQGPVDSDSAFGSMFHEDDTTSISSSIVGMYSKSEHES